MRLEYSPAEPRLRWTATTDDEQYDGAGETPLDAVCVLATVLEHEIKALSA